MPGPLGRPMQDIPNLPAALRHQAASDPESPCLFWPQGWDWRWWSWRRVAELAAGWSVALDGLPPAAGVAFAGDWFPQAVPLDLAVRMAGLTPVPVTVGRGGGSVPSDAAEARRLAVGAPPGCVAWAEAAGEEVRVTRLGDAGEARGTGDAGGAGDASGAGEAGDVGGASGAPLGMSGPAGAAGGELQVAARGEAALLDAAAAVESAVAATAGRRRDSRDREVLVAGWPLGRWEGRLFGAWALLSGAVLVLEPDPERRPGAVRWARPTVFYGSADELAALRLQATARAGAGRRWLAGLPGLPGLPRRPDRHPPRPWGRLRTLFQDGSPDAAEAAFWAARGARLLRLPGPGDGGRGDLPHG